MNGKVIKKLIFLFLLLCSIACEAQDKPAPGMKQVEAAHVAWITRQLQLSPQEAQRFWPVYNNYQRELKALQKERREARSQKTSPENNELNFDTRVLDLRKRYLGEFNKTLPGNRAARLFRADREFNDQLLQQLRKRGKRQ
jgi:hypothetical protein